MAQARANYALHAAELAYEGQSPSLDGESVVLRLVLLETPTVPEGGSSEAMGLQLPPTAI